MISKVLVRVGLIAGPFVLSAVAWTHPVRPALTCSNATLQGNYGFLVTGTSAGNPIAILGQITADGNGGLTGMETVNDNGAITDTAPVTGTYKIGSKCVGTATITSQGGTAASYNLAESSPVARCNWWEPTAARFNPAFSKRRESALAHSPPSRVRMEFSRPET
jgi:hypothetical protein